MSAPAPGTPLPWMAESDGCLSQVGTRGDFLPIASPWIEDAFNGDETAIANAAYIVWSANNAPSLLEALQEAVQCIDPVIYPVAYKAVRAAISKATGAA